MLVAAVTAFIASSPAMAQSGASLDDLARRVAAEQSEADRLSAETAAVTAKARGIQVAQLFGESDEEKAAEAARLQREQAQDSNLATLNQRVNDLDETLRRLTGQIEELDHRLSEQNERMARMRKDFDYKICSLVAQQIGATTEQGEDTSLPCAGQTPQQSSGTPAPAAPAATQGTVHLSPPPGVLGTLSRGDLGNLPQPSQSEPNQMASIDPRPQFEAALNLLAKAQYDEARAAFRGFADNYPNDDLAAQAVYWVGDISYVQRDYAGAARAFAEELKKYPTSPRAPESMLKLGQSLLALNQKKEGCRALGTLSNQFPAASKSVTDEALAARKTAGCR